MKKQQSKIEKISQEKIMGFGNKSSRKSYYPELQNKLEQLNKFKYLIDNVNDAIVLVDLDNGQIEDHNETFIKWLKQDKVKGVSFYKYICKKNKDRIKETMSDLRDGKIREISFDSEIIIDDKTKIPVIINLNVSEYFGQKYSTVVLKDISVRRSAEKAYQKSEEQYKTLIENLNVGIVVQNEKRETTMINKKAINYLEIDSVDIIGKDFFSEIRFLDSHSVELENEVNPLNWITINKEKISNLILGFEKEDEILWYLFNIFPQLNEKGEIEQIISTFNNFSELKQKEDEIKLLNERLELRVKERTYDLENAVKELKDFAYIVSHDLKAPLRGISQISTWLKEDYDEQIDDDGKQMLDLLVSRVQRMSNLINAILQYSRVSKPAGSKMEFKFGDSINDTIDLLQVPKNIKVNIEGVDTILNCDIVRFGQIFQNLISNALRYIDPKEGEIEISSDDSDPDYIHFFVKDNGVGIDEKYFNKIFEIFQTLENKDESESTGIGLTIVKKIVEYFGGKIWLESEIGKGSKFNFTIKK